METKKINVSEKNPMREWDVTLKNGDVVRVAGQYCMPTAEKGLLFGVDDMRTSTENSTVLTAVFPNGKYLFVKEVSRA